MASIRDLKKTVDYLAGAVVTDCINYAIYARKHDEEVSRLVEEIVSFRNDARARVADGKSVEKKERRAFYRAIASDMLAKTDECFAKLSELVKQ